MRIGFWIKNARSIALPQSALPCLTAVILCIGQDGFVWWLAIPVVLGICAAHLGMNLADDYFDYKHDSRTRADISSTSVRARMEKCHYLGERLEVKGERQEEKATLSELGWAIVGFLAFAAAMGGIVLVGQWLLHGWQAAMGIVIYAVLGLIIGINYSGKPLELGFHGLGELVIGLMFGPLLMLGVQAALTGTAFSWEMLCMSIGIGCMVTNIVYVHSVMEVNADAELGKMTFARLLFEAKSIGTPQSHSDSSPINKGAKRGDEVMRRLGYDEVDEQVMREHRIIVNCTPLGMQPYENEMPDIPYHYLSKEHLLYDCIYNPERTLFLQEGEKMGCQVKNGLEMLHRQADEACLVFRV